MIDQLFFSENLLAFYRKTPYYCTGCMEDTINKEYFLAIDQRYFVFMDGVSLGGARLVFRGKLTLYVGNNWKNRASCTEAY